VQTQISIEYLDHRYRHLIETVQPTNHWQATDTFLSGIQRSYPPNQQLTNDAMDMKNFYSTSATSPSATTFPQIFTYVQPNFNHRLTSNVDDNSLLIQNPSLT